MRKGCVAFIGLSLIGLTLASCGRFQREQRAAWRDEAEAACMSRGEVTTSAYVSLRGSPIDGPGTCGMTKPLRVAAFAGGGIGLTSTQTLACPIVSTTDRFLEKVVQPAAMGVLGTQVIEMRAGSYSCRAMNNGSGTTRRSEHAYGNALDIFAFRTSDGREITVKDGWRGSPQEQDFLREVFVGACEYYKTVLGPGADMFHYDHFHVDLARHNGGRSICKPIIKFTPRRDLPPPDPASRNFIAMAPRGPTPPGMTPSGLAPPVLPAQPRTTVARAEPQGGSGFVGQAPRGAQLNAPGGPIRLPGSVMGSEEIVVGDVEGELIDPENDPFALEEPGRPRPTQSQAVQPPMRAPSSLQAPQPHNPLPPMRGPQPLGAPPVLPAPPQGPGQYRWTPGPQPLEQTAQSSSRPWPPRF